MYEGEFKSGLKHGKGKYIAASGLIFEGSYLHGVKSGEGKIINRDGSLSYEGEFLNGLPHGKGISYKDGEVLREG